MGNLLLWQTPIAIVLTASTLVLWHSPNADPGVCTRTAGYIANAEINAILSDPRCVTPGH